MKDLFKKLFSAENRVKTIGIGVGILVVIVGIIVIPGTFAKPDSKIEKQLTKKMQEMAKDFYENYYYDQVGSDFVKQHSEDGIKIDLANLARINNSDSKAVLDEFKNSNGESCNTTNTKATIYPKDPYGKSDYELKINIDCNLKK